MGSGEFGVDALGDVKKYPVLNRLTEELKRLDERKRHRVLRYIDELHKIRHIAHLTNESSYLKTLVIRDFYSRLEVMVSVQGLSETLYHLLKNYTKAILVNTLGN